MTFKLCYSSNSSLSVFQIGEVTDIGKNLGIPLIINNTACPIICKPIEHSAAIVMHSLTKYISGHGTSIGGITIDSGNFDWSKNKSRHPNIWEPDKSYHGAVCGDAVPQLTGANIPFIIRAKVVFTKEFGSYIKSFKFIPNHSGNRNFIT